MFAAIGETTFVRLETVGLVLQFVGVGHTELVKKTFPFAFIHKKKTIHLNH